MAVVNCFSDLAVFPTLKTQLAVFLLTSRSLQPQSKLSFNILLVAAVPPKWKLSLLQCCQRQGPLTVEPERRALIFK